MVTSLADSASLVLTRSSISGWPCLDGNKADLRIPLAKNSFFGLVVFSVGFCLTGEELVLTESTSLVSTRSSPSSGLR